MKSARSVRIITGISIAVLSISAVSALAFTTVTASIEKIDAFAGLDKRPDKKSSAVNYLIVGSDTREGLTRAEQKALRVGSVKTAAGKRSDTMLLVHISKSRDRAVLVSIPRDSYALIPEHLNSQGKTIPAAYSKLNSSFNWGGAPLLIETIEQMTEFFSPERKICICRELTKKFEEAIRGSLKDIHANINNYKLIGEIVLVIEGISKEELKEINNAEEEEES